ncbi:PAS domain-containing sensor histidine kinase [Phaeodactylibacter sp.]|uniref:PAS domain-containing sensor histidine kinase n=1 Tax=Phaeodactylibacter sp. TaxID=1940289 RepID=UPI0025D36E45|nr:PAS domain-containing sensor histidine kinase [Phaeodactylibacter sp.]MCI4649819.1 PAS domain-containing sensor histidine kinase [Phaeodactylibacter sp.]MCI5092235.1 PAS domain-containing sensor histidine kinase [Phaeodactylibacter sp.]
MSAWLKLFDDSVQQWLQQHLEKEIKEACSFPIPKNLPELAGTDLLLSELKLLPTPVAEEAYTVVCCKTCHQPDNINATSVKPNQFLQKFDLAGLIDNALSGVWYSNLTDSTSFSTDGINKVRGYKDAKSTISWQKTILPEDIEKVSHFFDQCLNAPPNTASKAILRHRHRDGHIIHLMVMGQKVEASEGKSIELFGIWVDVTEQEQLRKQLEAALWAQKAQSEYLKRLLNGLPEITLVANRQTGKITDCNAAVFYKLGYTKAEVIGQQHTFAYLPEYRAAADKAFDDGVVPPADVVVHLMKKDGSQLPTRLSHTEAELNGQPVLIGTFTDLTEVEAAKERLKNNEALYRQLIQNSNEYIAIMDHDFVVEWISQNFADLLGFPVEELIGKKLNTFIPPEEQVRLTAIFKAAFERGDNVIAYETRVRTSSGNYVWMKGRYVFLTNESGVPKIYSYRQDISREKEIQQKQQEMTRLKNEFVSMTSHQLRTPMVVFASNLELLEALIPDEQTAVRRILKRMNTESDRMVHLLDEVLLLSRLESGKLEAAKHKTYNLVELIRTFCRDGVCSVANVQTDLPGDPIWVSVDKDQFEHILINLLNNAIKYTPPIGQSRLYRFAVPLTMLY